MIKINMGCGWRNFGKEWIHIDGGKYDHLDYDNIMNLQNFDDNSVDLIYSSHVIEYFDREEVLELLTEWKRVLKPEGVLRLAVPNFEAMCKLYLDSNYIKYYYGKIRSLSRRKKKNKLLGEIVSRTAWIKLKEFSAFKIDDGQICSIVDEDEGLIDAAFLDEISDVISEDFGRLLDLEDDL